MKNFSIDTSDFNHINFPILICDKDLNIIYSNNKLNSILNINNSDNLTKLFNKKELEIIKSNSSLLNEKKSTKYKIRINNTSFLFNSKTININNKSYDFITIENVTSIDKNIEIKECIYKISEASHFVDDLNQLYPIIHKTLSRILYTKNFYIALADWKNNIIHFPYFVDDFDRKPQSKEIENGLTEYVCKSGESILVNPDQYDKLIKSKKVDLRGKKSVDWLGVPLKGSQNETIGAVVIQSYDEKIRFYEEDQKILTFVSDQIAMAIKRKMDNLEIQKKAYFDPVTGLTNKILFNDRLNQNIHHADRNKENIGVLFIDLDNFKYVNDSMGHTAGDRLLKIVAERLNNCLRKTDTVARWGGDEFSIILPKIKNVKDISLLCHRILQNELTNIILDNQELRITASIGIALFPQDGDSVEALIQNADTAMYKAKEKGKNQFRFFKPKMNIDIKERVSNESNLYKAIKNEEFILLFQPQINLKDNKLIGFEALIRWNSPDKGVLAPYKFIPIAEETNLIIPLGQWIIEETCKQNKKWHDMGYKLTCAVNISAKQFVKSNLVNIIKTVLKKTNLKPEYLELELTETILMENIDKTLTILNELKKMGVKVSIDDFGTGYSSLSYLKKFPIDTLKIDQSFISTIRESKDDQSATIANIVIDLGHKLGMNVIAEGVETKEQVDFLKKYACDKIQGYIISEPVNEIEFNLLLNKEAPFK